MVHKALKGCTLVVASKGNHEPQKIKGWLKEASGQLANKVTADVTHLVIDNLYKQGELHQSVQEVYKLRRSGHEIKIVTFDWLMDSLRDKKKKKEKKPYLLEDESERRSQAGEPRSQQGLVKQVFFESTESAMTPALKKQCMEQKKRDEAVAQEQKAEELRADNEYLHKNKKLSMPEFAAVFKKGAQKAKQCLLSDNHHVYQDTTGFNFDVMLTKVDTQNNTNERYNLLIFESNIVPHTYAFSTILTGTKLLFEKKIVVAIGATFPTAFSAFKRVFEDMTGIPWDRRLKAYVERQETEQLLKRSKNMGEHSRNSLGVPGPQSVEDFRDAKYQYIPPSYGPKGEFDDGSHVKGVARSKGKGRAGNNESDKEDFLMSGGNGKSPVQAEFGLDDLQNFHEAMQAEGSDRLDPLAAPFSFGPETNFEELTWRGEPAATLGSNGGDQAVQGGFEGATSSQHNGDTGNMCQEGDGLGSQQKGLTSSVAYDDYDFTQEPAEAALDLGSSILGKRKEDSPMEESSEKRRKKEEDQDQNQAPVQPSYEFEFDD